jgi:pilus assembly protein CpaC
MFDAKDPAVAVSCRRVSLKLPILAAQMCVLIAASSNSASAQQPSTTNRARAQSATVRTTAPGTARKLQRVQLTQAEEVLTGARGGDERIDKLVNEIQDYDDVIEVVMRRARLFRFKKLVMRTAVADPSIAEVVQVTPRELQLIGKGEGTTTLSIWFAADDPNADPEVITYLINGVKGPERRQQLMLLEESIHRLFPDSRVELVPVADRLIVRGEARDPEQASHIMKIIEAHEGEPSSEGPGPSLLGLQPDAPGPIDGSPMPNIPPGQTPTILRGTSVGQSRIINMLKVPGQFQVMLKCKIAEINRGAGRQFGMSFSVAKDEGGFRLFQSILAGASGNIVGVFDAGDVEVFINALRTHSVGKILAQPNLMTLSGQPAWFTAGGAFAVPTVVGINGVGGIATGFQRFGTLLTFVPTVLDKDLIRLTVTPTFSQPNLDLRVNIGGGGGGGAGGGGVPGLNIRSATTTVELREGQVLAIAGLFQETVQSDETRIPLLGDIPVLGNLMSTRRTNREETELVVLIEPVLMAPMEPEQVPPLPGFDFKEPDDFEFFVLGMREGSPVGPEYRSTLWPYHPGNTSTYLRLQNTYLVGPHGHSSADD